MTFSITKCKEHYIDCYNVVSYDIFDMCTKLKVLKHLSLSTMRHKNIEFNSGLVYVCIFDFNFSNTILSSTTMSYYLKLHYNIDLSTQ